MIMHELGINVSRSIRSKRRKKFQSLRLETGALNPIGINLQCALNPAAAAGPEGLWPGGSRGHYF